MATTKKNDNEHKTISIRINHDLLNGIEDMAENTGRSISGMIRVLVRVGLKHINTDNPFWWEDY